MLSNLRFLATPQRTVYHKQFIGTSADPVYWECGPMVNMHVRSGRDMVEDIAQISPSPASTLGTHCQDVFLLAVEVRFVSTFARNFRVEPA